MDLSWIRSEYVTWLAVGLLIGWAAAMAVVAWLLDPDRRRRR